MVNIDQQKIEEVLSRGVEEVIDRGNLKKKLQSGRVLRIKLGIDPTSPNIHLGRAISLLKLRDFQDLGHKAIFIIGDSTGVIGDTSDKDAERPMLTPEQVKMNGVNYFKQALKILDKKKTEVHYNSEWLKKLGWLDIAKMANLFGLNEFSSREVIAKRMDAGKRVSYLEMMYPLFQGYDSVMVKADVELGGTDQRFNLLTGRKIQQFYDQQPQDIVMTPLVEGLDGRKMSSSWGNTVNLLDTAQDMFGKIMSLGDELIIKYFTLATRVPLSEIEIIKAMPNPKDQKVLLAKEIVKMYHGQSAAQKAEEEWNQVFVNKELPSEMEIFTTDKKTYPILDLLCDSKLAPSKNEAKRLVEGGAITIEITNHKSPAYRSGRQITNKIKIQNWKEEITLEDGMVVQAGKRRFVKIKLR